MKTKHWLTSAVIFATAWMAHSGRADAQAAPPKVPPAVAPAPSSAPAVPLAPGVAVAKQNNINVRGQAAIQSEIVTRLKQGDRVTILEEITLKRPQTDEPDKWAKIALPADTPVWVHGAFVDPATLAVVPKRLNLRAGPGENYSILGRVEKGTVLKQIEVKGEWIKIEPPAGAYAFVAAHLLAPETVAPPVATVAVTPPPPVEVVVPPPVEIAPPAVVTPPPVLPPPVAVAPPPPVEPEVVEPPELVLVQRIVSREGLVRRSVSIQAPTYFILESLDTGRTINYLYSPSTNLVLKDYRGQRIVVTGEELLDERWPNTPVITVDSIRTVP